MITDKKHRTAVLIFANSAHEDARQKSIPKSNFFFEELSKNIIKKVEKTGLPYYTFSEIRQRGFSFGEKFTNAIQDVFNLGYDNVIAIGNDTPELKTFQILNASEKLKDNKTVLGPSADGGFYLLGINKCNFKANVFNNFSWCTSKITSEITEWLVANSLSTFKLKTLRDVDSIDDLRFMLNLFRKISNRIRLEIVEILRLFAKTLLRNILFGIKKTFLPSSFNKGSPLL